MTDQRTQQVAVHVVVTDDARRVLLARSDDDGADRWALPGGVLRFGEDPGIVVRRIVAAHTDAPVGQLPVWRVLSNIDTADQGVVHTVRLIYRGHVPVPRKANHPSSFHDDAELAWVQLRDVSFAELAGFTADILAELHRPHSEVATHQPGWSADATADKIVAPTGDSATWVATATATASFTMPKRSALWPFRANTQPDGG